MELPQESKCQNLLTMIKTGIPLADKNWFKTGGLAHHFSEPSNTVEFQNTLAYAHQHRLPIALLGEGSNSLVSDDGYQGLLIRPALNYLHHTMDGQYALVTAGTGARMHDVILYCLDNALLGLEEFSGIPGTVGGSVYINLHYFEFLLEQFLVSAKVLDVATSTLHTVDASWFNFRYNYSTLHEKKQYLVDATFAVRQGDKLEASYARGRRAEMIRHRQRHYPTSGTCGSFFRNFYQHEVTLEIQGKKMISIAYYLDKLGVKGSLAIGGAQVSHQHANMIVNTGHATSSDIIELARTLQSMVYKTYGIMPQPECEFIGFNTYPLL